MRTRVVHYGALVSNPSPDFRRGGSTECPGGGHVSTWHRGHRMKLKVAEGLLRLLNSELTFQQTERSPDTQGLEDPLSLTARRKSFRVLLWVCVARHRSLRYKYVSSVWSRVRGRRIWKEKYDVRFVIVALIQVCFFQHCSEGQPFLPFVNSV